VKADRIPALLYETGAEILESQDLEQVLAVVSRRVPELLAGAGSSVAFYDLVSELLEVRAATGVLEGAIGNRFEAVGTLSRCSIADLEPVVRNDLPLLPFYEGIAVVGPAPGRALVVPVREGERAIATIAVVRHGDAEPFTDDDAQLLTSVAHLCGLATENAKLRAAEKVKVAAEASLRIDDEEHIARLVELHAAEVDVSADLDLDAVLQVVADKARELTDAEFGALGVLEETGPQLERFITSGVSEERRAMLGPLPTGHGLLGAVTRSESPIRVADLSGDPRSVGVSPHHPEMTSFIGAPIRVGSRMYGNIYVTNKSNGGPFTDRDESVLTMLAARAAVSIENARQFSALQRLLRELQTTQKQRDRFYAFVNHDLRNACSGVMMWTERLVGRDEVDVEIAEKIRRGSEHAMRLVQDVLDLENVGQGRLETWPRTIIVYDLLEAAIDAVRPEAERRSLELVLTPGDDGLRMVADPDRVLQIIGNLLGNAVKFTNEDTPITVFADHKTEGPDSEHEGPWVTIEVKDEGPGIKAVDRERIFGEYVQVDSKSSTGGMGIGLTLSRQLAEYMGGALTVESEPGQGARFTLWIPYAREPERREGWIG